ncbi:LysR family transcriptional regulator [Carbonactinospora thermoautotrophica]|uniref:LysR family transcriptional regulator n=1 Tax=Carbonactinospora thermoautotrophica TaxID=1469144 RepID=A0A132N1Z1_9ACTN|nr:LysR substrate-binding domain-containing protein [Carbonactinospora thermoautotrophica]KWX04114.1 LysR family transcriptional regulator [Carbonactinospora thermoautotrophica]
MTTAARLRAFVAVAETGSVRAAAQRLVVTESAVSAAIAALTREVGVPLVEREGRGLRLTLSGRTFADYARTILGLHEEALSAARGEMDPERGRVRVAAVTTAGEHVLPVALAAFRARHPGVDLRLEVGTSEHVWTLLMTHEADLVIAGRPPQDVDDVVVRAVRPNELLVVAAPAVAEEFDLARTTWLLREVGSGTRATCEALLANLEVDPPRLTLGSNGAVVAGAVAGLGVTLVSRDAVARELSEGELVVVEVPGTPLHRPWHAVTHRRFSATAGLLVDHLLSGEDGGSVGWCRPS